MSIPDIVNGSFELSGAAFVILSIRRLLRDRCVRGVDWRTVAFWTTWGLWNLFYYPQLGQWWSFAGGIAVVSTNFFWIVMMLYYIRMEHGKT